MAQKYFLSVSPVSPPSRFNLKQWHKEDLMPLRKSPVRTPAFLAANRANARKSTGPRTPQGKARISFNSFKHGRYAARPEDLAERLLRAGCHREAALYRQVRWQIGRAFLSHGQPQSPAKWNRLYRLSAWVWCFRTRLRRPGTLGAGGLGAKPECAVLSVGEEARVTSRTRIRVEDQFRRIGLVFWVQHRRYWNPRRIGRVLAGLDSMPGWEEVSALEGGLRCLLFRMRKPRNWEERFRYGLDREGNFSSELYFRYRALARARRANP
jgi:hypothetical protein